MLDGSLSAGGNLSFIWSDADGFLISNQTFITISAAGAYTLEVKNETNGCTASDTVNVLSNPDAITSVLADVLPERCIDDSNGEILVNSVNGGTPPYQFSLDELHTNTLGTFTGLAHGMYQMHISDANGCMLDTAFLVGAGAYLTISLPPVIELTEGQSGHVNAAVNVPLNQLAGVQWIPPGFLACDTCLVTTMMLAADQHFQLTVTHINGCMAVAELDIVIVPGPEIFIPNVFSPNRDGINDYFTLYANDRVEKIERLDIFDRWGDHVYHRHDFQPNEPEYGWDGTFRNELVHPGAFVYVVELLMRDGSTELRKGDITIIR
jgi:gliding motility-associated-like protein